MTGFDVERAETLGLPEAEYCLKPPSPSADGATSR